MSATVVTFDDVTELVQAQRTGAWADVARRIAHEIKNPLTPIQLSAERLRRKYGKSITEDRETFDTLTETIERQTGEIKSMVDEFAAFARMPKPEMADHDLRHAVQEPAVLFREGHTDVDFKLSIPDRPVRCRFDRRLVSQAVTNLVKNAAEAIEAYARSRKDVRPTARARSKCVWCRRSDRVAIEVIDNGVGLPKQNRAKPARALRHDQGAQGHGLGLAIVQKSRRAARRHADPRGCAAGARRGRTARSSASHCRSSRPDSLAEVPTDQVPPLRMQRAEHDR